MEENTLIRKLHEIIDKEFNRKDRSKKVSPYILKQRMTIWSLSKYFIGENPIDLVLNLKKLIDRGSVVSNMIDVSFFPFDSYFIPKSELLDEKEFDIYLQVKKQLL